MVFNQALPIMGTRMSHETGADSEGKASEVEDFMSSGLSPSSEFGSDSSGLPEAVVLGGGAGRRIAVPRAVLCQIFEEVDGGFKLLQRRGGMEIGGLLVGPKQEGADLLVEEALPVRVEYKSGPVFKLCPTELENIESTVKSIQELEARAIVGFYRSITRGRDSLLDSDTEILKAIEQANPASGPVRCCLLFAPVSRSEMSVRAIMRDGDHWDQTEVTIRRDPFEADPAMSVLPASTKSMPEPQAMELTAPQVLESPTRPESAGRHRNLGLYVMIGLVSLMVVSDAYRWFVSSRAHESSSGTSQGQSSQPAGRLGFAANREGSAWRLTWSRDAVDALNPVGATLSIRDGDANRNIALTAADLSSGMLYYSPQGGELAFRLEVEKHQGEAVAERIQVLEAVAPAGKGTEPRGSAPVLIHPSAFPAVSNAKAVTGVTQAAAAITKSAPAGPANLPADTRTTDTRTADSRAKDTNVATPPASTAPSGGPSNAQTKEVNLDVPTQPSLRPSANEPGSSSPPASAVSALAVPVAAPAKPPAALPAARVNQASMKAGPPTQPAPPAVALAKETSTPSAALAKATAAPGTLTPGLGAAARPPTPPKQPTYAGPKPIRQVTPTTPPGIALTGPTQVQVLVAIDAKGKVTKVTPVGQQTNVALMSAAARAAQFWEFEPERQDGQAIPSAMTLIFKF